MNPIRSIASSSRFRAVSAMLVLFVATGEAAAAKKAVEDVTAQATFRGKMPTNNGGEENWSCQADIVTNLFDGSVETGIAAGNGYYFVADFSPVLTAEEPMMYVDEITIEHVTARKYSLYVSTNYAPASPSSAAWTPVATNVTNSGRVAHKRQERIKAIKYVFENANGTKEDLCGFHVTGFRSSEPKVVSKWQLAWIYKPDGTPMPHESGGWDSNPNYPDGFGGGTHINALFNTNFNDNVYIGPNGRLDNKGYCQLDFSSEAPNGWFVTEIKTGSKTTHPYSLYYSMDGTTWSPVEDGTNVCSVGKRRFNVYDTAVYVKCVFDEVGGWTPAFNELQVWGMNPEDVACEHPSYTEWVFDDSLTDCLLFPVDKRHCTVCGAVFTREEFWAPPPGHKYVVSLEQRGIYKGFGRGHISCARCDFFLDCPAPIDLITNRVNGTQIGDIKADGFIRFTDVSVSSTGNTDWGVRPGHLIDNNWTWTWNAYWYSDNNENHPDTNPHVDYEFGTEIDLTWIDLSVDNGNFITRFYSVDDQTDEETPLERFLVARTDKDHAYTVEGPEPEDIYSDRELDELVVIKDETISPYAMDGNGEVVYESDGKPKGNSDNFQRFTVRFFEQPIRHLRIRQTQSDGETARRPMYLSELHPWGTVKGAGDLRYRKETIMILR